MINNFSTDFEVKLNGLIDSYCCWKNQDKIENENPDFTYPLLYTNSWIYRFRMKRKIKAKLRHIEIQKLKQTYDWLCDEYSKDIFLMCVLKKYIDFNIIRLPLYYSSVFDRKYDIEKKIRIDDTEIILWFNIIKLHRYDLSKIGFPIKVLTTLDGVIIDYLRRQYDYKNIVNIKEGDYIIDGGGCYGDTALLFAYCAGATGKVFSFEFMPENLSIFSKNLLANPELSSRIHVINKALYNGAGRLFFKQNGPGTSVNNEVSENSIETIAIDDFVKENNIEKVDFIKMDIEGSEIPALTGAIKTIKKFHPKLAICSYHKYDDYYTIPYLIKKIDATYKLYFNHHTISKNESVIYAV